MVKESDSRSTTPAQDMALAALLRGETATRAAEEAHVSRQTVSNWIHHDPVFIAARNQAQKELWDRHMDQRRKLTGMVLTQLEELMKRPMGLGPLLEVLKAFKSDAGPTGSTDPQEIADTQEIGRLRREVEKLSVFARSLDLDLAANEDVVVNRENGGGIESDRGMGETQD